MSSYNELLEEYKKLKEEFDEHKSIQLKNKSNRPIRRIRT